MFKVSSKFQPQGSQPAAIEALVAGFNQGEKGQVLLGVTGSGKTFTIANVIEAVQRPTLVIAHNKVLAAQLYAEFKSFFPNNAVEYFVSYYDYFQPEAYVARSDTYIEKDLAVNDKIDKLRLSATRSLIERDDVLIVSSISCIYGLGLPEYYARMKLTFKVGESYRWDELLLHLVEMHYRRTHFELRRSTFRSRGDVLDIQPGYEEDQALRIEFFDDEVERISEIDPLTGKVLRRCDQVTLYPASHHVTPEEVRERAIESILAELEERVEFFAADEPKQERIQLRTLQDIELIREIGYCKGIENYSRHFSGRQPGDPPPCLIDYFPEDYLMVVDESHQTVPQWKAMAEGDFSRKKTLVEYGFRLPSAFDNRPLRADEIRRRINKAIYVSATPGEWEMKIAGDHLVPQLIRPTGLLDPPIEVRPATGQVDDLLEEIRLQTARGYRTLATVLTKELAEDLTSYLVALGIRAKYLHAEITALKRIQIIRDLRLGTFDVLVGINLLREGLDLPEVALVAILDADNEGFLRSPAALIQTAGRAARNVEGRVIFYADRRTRAIEQALQETARRRELQQAYNQEHGITPTSIEREITVELPLQEVLYEEGAVEAPRATDSEEGYLTLDDIRAKIADYRERMLAAAKEQHFDEAARYRDLMHKYETMELAYG